MSDACPFGLCDGTGFRYDEATNTAYDCRCRPQRKARAKARSLSAVIPRRYRDVSFERPPVTDIDPAIVAATRRYAATVEDQLEGPIFVIDYPTAICPLAKQSDEDPRIAERFELFVCGMEVGNAFSELNDPIDQQHRFEGQLEHVDEESPSEVDFDYVGALEYGMPPAGGLGIGIDRLAMLLAGADSIRDVVLFPLLRRLDGAPAVPDEGDEQPEN